MMQQMKNGKLVDIELPDWCESYQEREEELNRLVATGTVYVDGVRIPTMDEIIRSIKEQRK